MRKLTTSEFIQRSKDKHGEHVYDYSDTEYVNNRTPVIIRCIKHNHTFTQLPYKHYEWNGCELCSSTAPLSTNEFVKRAEQLHGNRYDYSKTVYRGNKRKLIVTCPVHGDFSITPNKHLDGVQCTQCSLKIRGEKRRTTQHEFEIKSKQIHGDKYDYSKTVYDTASLPVIISCPVHGDFEQTPDIHLRGSGCKKCSTNVSHLEQQWLDSLNVEPNNRQVKIVCYNKTFKVDGMSADQTTLYEFYGDFWHGNPKIYKKNEINVVNNVAFGVLYRNTLKREVLLRSLGYNVATMWESNFNQHTQR